VSEVRCMCVCVFSFSTPSLVFIGGSHPEFAAHICKTDLSKQQGGTTWQSCGGGAHGPGRPTSRSAGLAVAPPTFPFGPRVPSWAHLSLARVWAIVLLVSCSGGPSIPHSDTCRVLICWSVMSWIKPHHYTAKSAGNHLHTF